MPKEVWVLSYASDAGGVGYVVNVSATQQRALEALQDEMKIRNTIQMADPHSIHRWGMGSDEMSAYLAKQGGPAYTDDPRLYIRRWKVLD